MKRTLIIMLMLIALGVTLSGCDIDVGDESNQETYVTGENGEIYVYNENGDITEVIPPVEVPPATNAPASTVTTNASEAAEGSE